MSKENTYDIRMKKTSQGLTKADQYAYHMLKKNSLFEPEYVYKRYIYNKTQHVNKNFFFIGAFIHVFWICLPRIVFKSFHRIN